MPTAKQLQLPRFQRLTESPDLCNVDGLKMDFSHPHAYAFFFLGGKVVFSSRVAHQAIFRELKALDPSYPLRSGAYNEQAAKRSQANLSAYLRKEGVQTFPKLEPQDYQAWLKVQTGDHGELRQRTKAGRAWVNVKGSSGLLSVFSFWVRGRQVSDQEVDLLVQAFKAKGRILVEFMGSAAPAEYKSWRPSEAEEAKTLRSARYPNLTPDQIIQILVRNHTEPSSLSKQEREVVAELGHTKAASKISLGGYGTTAERRFRTTVGESRARRIIEGSDN